MTVFNFNQHCTLAGRQREHVYRFAAVAGSKLKTVATRSQLHVASYGRRLPCSASLPSGEECPCTAANSNQMRQHKDKEGHKRPRQSKNATK